MDINELKARGNELLAQTYPAFSNQASRGRMPERVFRETFLPWFLNNVQATPTYNYPEQWIAISGGPTAEVEVFLESTGEVVFIVPPLLDSSQLRMNSQTSVKALVYHFLETRDTNSQYASKFVRGALNDVLQNARAVYSTDAAQKWQHIFNYYGITPATAGPNVNNSPAAAAIAGDDHLEFY